jgi:hypothetical protein
VQAALLASRVLLAIESLARAPVFASQLNSFLLSALMRSVFSLLSLFFNYTVSFPARVCLLLSFSLSVLF